MIDFVEVQAINSLFYPVAVASSPQETPIEEPEPETVPTALSPAVVSLSQEIFSMLTRWRARIEAASRSAGAARDQVELDRLLELVRSLQERM